MSQACALHPAIDPAALREAYARDRRVQIAPFLAGDGAAKLRDHLSDREDWTLALRAGSREFAFDPAQQAELGPDKLAALRSLAAPGEEAGFAYAYERIVARLRQSGEQESGTPLADFAAFLSSDPVLALLRNVTGADEIGFVDAKASRYTPGDFLTLHHDRQDGSTRIAAYVFGLTEGWRAENGGLLLFHEPGGEIERGFVPAMNALTLFAVPQGHSVSQVTSFAPVPRLSVTGWLLPR